MTTSLPANKWVRCPVFLTQGPTGPKTQFPRPSQDPTRTHGPIVIRVGTFPAAHAGGVSPGGGARSETVEDPGSSAKRRNSRVILEFRVLRGACAWRFRRLALGAERSGQGRVDLGLSRAPRPAGKEVLRALRRTRRLVWNPFRHVVHKARSATARFCPALSCGFASSGELSLFPLALLFCFRQRQGARHLPRIRSLR